MKTFKYLFLFVAFIYSTNHYAQVGIGTTNPDSSSVLDISSTEGGLLLPRLSSQDRTNITSAAVGLLIYNTTINCIEWYTGNAGTPWENACGIAYSASRLMGNSQNSESVDADTRTDNAPANNLQVAQPAGVLSGQRRN